MVSYRGTQPALTDLMGGSAQSLIDPSFALLPATGDGRIRALGIAAAQRSSLAPDVPTMAEAGLPGFEFQVLVRPLGRPRARRPRSASASTR